MEKLSSKNIFEFKFKRSQYLNNQSLKIVRMNKNENYFLMGNKINYFILMKLKVKIKLIKLRSHVFVSLHLANFLYYNLKLAQQGRPKNDFCQVGHNLEWHIAQQNKNRVMQINCEKFIFIYENCLKNFT